MALYFVSTIFGRKQYKVLERKLNKNVRRKKQAVFWPILSQFFYQRLNLKIRIRVSFIVN